MNCPLCGQECIEEKINSPSLFASQGRNYRLHSFMCPTKITMINGVMYNHFTEDLGNGTTYMWLPSNYRIINVQDKSRVSIMKCDLSGHHMQTLFQCPVIKPDSPEKLVERIKILLLLS